MGWYVLIALIVVSLIILFGKLKKTISLVKENSAKYIKLDKLNKISKFNENVRKKINIDYFVKSKTELSQINFDELIINLLQDNVNNSYLNLKATMENEKKYDSYLKKYNAIDDVTEAEIIAVTNIKLKTFNALENRLFKKNKIKPVVNTKVIVTAKFDTPKGENKYQKERVFKYDDLKNYYNKKEEVEKNANI